MISTEQARAMDVCQRAADWLEEHDWCRRRFSLPGGTSLYTPTSCCIQGALSLVERGSPYRGVSAAVDNLICRELPSSAYRDMTHYNDVVARRKGEVVRLLRHAGTIKSGTLDDAGETNRSGGDVG